MLHVPELPEFLPWKLKRYRKRLGFTQQDAAYFVRVSLEAWRSWEQGKNKMSDPTWELFLIKANRRLKKQKETNE